MNPFEQHGIEHLSPSTCNMFVASPAMFILTKLMKKKNSVGAAAHRGTAVETGIVHGLKNRAASLSDCVGAASSQFNILTAMSTDPRLTKEKEAIAGFVEQGLMELKPLGEPTGEQGKIEHMFDDLPVPFVGYYDLQFGDIIVDIKTTHSLPSKISINHARQVALYMAAMRSNDGRVTYVTSKKAATYRVENAAEHLNALKTIGMTIQSFLSVSKDAKELASMVIPDVDSFYFNDPITRQAAFEVWGV